MGLASTALRERNEGSHLREAGLVLGLGRLPLLKTTRGCVWGAGGPSGAVRGWEGIQKAELEGPAPGSDRPAPGSGSLGPFSR